MAEDRDDRAKAANDKGDMGPGATGGGYGSQSFESSEPAIVRGQQHMSGRYGDQAYGRTDGRHSGLPRDPSQRGDVADAASGALPRDAGQNAQISAGLPGAPVVSGREDERTSPGISTDKASDDTKPDRDR